jgi:hypothetical protein
MVIHGLHPLNCKKLAQEAALLIRVVYGYFPNTLSLSSTSPGSSLGDTKPSTQYRSEGYALDAINVA